MRIDFKIALLIGISAIPYGLVMIAAGTLLANTSLFALWGILVAGIFGTAALLGLAGYFAMRESGIAIKRDDLIRSAPWKGSRNAFQAIRVIADAILSGFIVLGMLYVALTWSGANPFHHYPTFPLVMTPPVGDKRVFVTAQIKDIVAPFSTETEAVARATLARYVGHLISVRGVVSDVLKVSVDPTKTNVLFESSNGMKGAVSAVFDGSHEKEVALLNKGQTISIICKIDGFPFGLMYLTNCEFRP